jgi:chromosome segregation ATPase
MNTGETQQLERNRSQEQQHTPLTEIEQIIQQIGARYIADLRILSEAFHQFYGDQLTAKDEHITELNQRLEMAERDRKAQEHHIAEPSSKLEVVERDRDALEARILELKDASERYISHLRALSEELGTHVAPAEDEPKALDAQQRGE